MAALTLRSWRIVTENRTPGSRRLARRGSRTPSPPAPSAPRWPRHGPGRRSRSGTTPRRGPRRRSHPAAGRTAPAQCRRPPPAAGGSPARPRRAGARCASGTPATRTRPSTVPESARTPPRCAGAQQRGVVDAVPTGQHPPDHRHRLRATVRAMPGQVQPSLDQPGQVHTLGQRRRRQQPGVRHRTRLVETHRDPAQVIRCSAPVRCPLVQVDVVRRKTHRPCSEGICTIPARRQTATSTVSPG